MAYLSDREGASIQIARTKALTQVYHSGERNKPLKGEKHDGGLSSRFVKDQKGTSA